MTANKIITKLLDEHKITGEEAVILIQECNKQETKIIHEYDVNKWNYPYTYPSITWTTFNNDNSSDNNNLFSSNLSID